MKSYRAFVKLYHVYGTSCITVDVNWQRLKECVYIVYTLLWHLITLLPTQITRAL